MDDISLLMIIPILLISMYLGILIMVKVVSSKYISKNPVVLDETSDYISPGRIIL
mgnify:CR=1 FL=1